MYWGFAFGKDDVRNFNREISGNIVIRNLSGVGDAEAAGRKREIRRIVG